MFLFRFLFSATPLVFPGTGYCYSNSFGERIVSKGDWLLYENVPANIKVENNGAVVYVESSLTVHNPLFSVPKL